jgi:quinolinate synthase
MKKITLEKLLITLEEMEPIVFVEEKIRTQALKAINQMLKVK